MTFETNDQYFAAWLLSNDVTLVTVVPGRWFHYIFDASEGEATRLLHQWRTGETLIQPKAFTQAIKRIKSLTRDWPGASMRKVEIGHGNNDNA
jgi:hypothetical protein